MATITTLATLQSEILALIGRAPADPVYQIVTDEINRDLRLLAMQTTQTVAEAATVALAAGFLEIDSVYRDADHRTTLTPVTPEVIHRTYETSGTPTRYAVVDGNLLLNRPGSGENLIIRYYAAVTELATSEDTNDVLTKHPEIYLYGALYHHALLIGDPRAQGWQAAYEGAKRRATTSDVKIRMAGAPGVPRPRGMTP